MMADHELVRGHDGMLFRDQEAAQKYESIYMAVAEATEPPGIVHVTMFILALEKRGWVFNAGKS